MKFPAGVTRLFWKKAWQKTFAPPSVVRFVWLFSYRGFVSFGAMKVFLRSQYSGPQFLGTPRVGFGAAQKRTPKTVTSSVSLAPLFSCDGEDGLFSY